VVAGNGTGVARIDARLVLMVRHMNSMKKLEEVNVRDADVLAGSATNPMHLYQCELDPCPRQRVTVLQTSRGEADHGNDRQPAIRS
jgi:hypothetical protein